MKKLLASLISLILLTTLLVGCEEESLVSKPKSYEELCVGRWRGQVGDLALLEVECLPDGKGYMAPLLSSEVYWGEWTIQGDTLIVFGEEFSGGLMGISFHIEKLEEDWVQLTLGEDSAASSAWGHTLVFEKIKEK